MRRAITWLVVILGVTLIAVAGYLSYSGEITGWGRVYEEKCVMGILEELTIYVPSPTRPPLTDFYNYTIGKFGVTTITSDNLIGKQVIACGEMKKTEVKYLGIDSSIRLDDIYNKTITYIDTSRIESAEFVNFSIPMYVVEGKEFDVRITLKNEFNSTLNDVNLSVWVHASNYYSVPKLCKSDRASASRSSMPEKQTESFSLMPYEKKNITFSFKPPKFYDHINTHISLNSSTDDLAFFSFYDSGYSRMLSSQITECGEHSIDLMVDDIGDGIYGWQKSYDEFNCSQTLNKTGRNVNFTIKAINRGTCKDKINVCLSHNGRLWPEISDNCMQKFNMTFENCTWKHEVKEKDTGSIVTKDWFFEVELVPNSSKEFILSLSEGIIEEDEIVFIAVSNETNAIDCIRAGVRKTP